MPKRRITAKRALQIKQWQIAGAKARKGRGKRKPRGKMITIYHHTYPGIAPRIKAQGFLSGNMAPDEIGKVFFTSKGQGSIVPHLVNSASPAARTARGITQKDRIPSGAIISTRIPAAAAHRDNRISDFARMFTDERFYAVNVTALRRNRGGRIHISKLEGRRI